MYDAYLRNHLCTTFICLPLLSKSRVGIFISWDIFELHHFRQGYSSIPKAIPLLNGTAQHGLLRWRGMLGWKSYLKPDTNLDCGVSRYTCGSMYVSTLEYKLSR